jgi:hypothetical protein
MYFQEAAQGRRRGARCRRPGAAREGRGARAHGQEGAWGWIVSHWLSSNIASRDDILPSEISSRVRK